MNRRFSLFVALCAICVAGVAIRANAASAQPGAPGRKFDHAELFAGTSSGQKKAGGSTKGTLRSGMVSPRNSAGAISCRRGFKN